MINIINLFIKKNMDNSKGKITQRIHDITDKAKGKIERAVNSFTTHIITDERGRGKKGNEELTEIDPLAMLDEEIGNTSNKRLTEIDYAAMSDEEIGKRYISHFNSSQRDERDLKLLHNEHLKRVYKEGLGINNGIRKLGRTDGFKK